MRASGRYLCVADSVVRRTVSREHEFQVLFRSRSQERPDRRRGVVAAGFAKGNAKRNAQRHSFIRWLDYEPAYIT